MGVFFFFGKSVWGEFFKVRLFFFGVVGWGFLERRGFLAKGDESILWRIFLGQEIPVSEGKGFQWNISDNY